MKRRDRRSRRGQALAEGAIVVLFLTVLALGIFEFGRAFMLTNVVAIAAGSGARLAGSLPPEYRDEDGCLTEAGRTLVTDRVRAELETYLEAGEIGDVVVRQSTHGDIPTVTVEVTGMLHVLMLDGLLGETIDLDRTKTYRDEGRESGHAC